MPMRVHYDESNDDFPAAAYAIASYPGVAWSVLGWETAPDEDSAWSGVEPRTGRAVACMIGDDHHFTFDLDDLTPLARAAYCGTCGQIGCTCDAYDRDPDYTPPTDADYAPGGWARRDAR